MRDHDDRAARAARLAVDRRGFIHGAGTLVLAAGLAGAMPGGLRAATGQRGGHLKLGIDSAGATDSLDPANTTA
jgi:hypothetical protein